MGLSNLLYLIHVKLSTFGEIFFLGGDLGCQLAVGCVTTMPCISILFLFIASNTKL